MPSSPKSSVTGFEIDCIQVECSDNEPQYQDRWNSVITLEKSDVQWYDTIPLEHNTAAPWIVLLTFEVGYIQYKH